MFKDTLAQVKESIKTMMTEKDISDEKLNALTSLNAQVDDLAKQHQELEESHSSMKDKYIEAITTYGTTKKPDEVEGGQPRTFEQIAQEVLAQK